MEITGADVREAIVGHRSPEDAAAMDRILAGMGGSWERLAYEGRRVAERGEDQRESNLIFAGFVSGLIHGIGMALELPVHREPDE